MIMRNDNEELCSMTVVARKRMVVQSAQWFTAQCLTGSPSPTFLKTSSHLPRPRKSRGEIRRGLSAQVTWEQYCTASLRSSPGEMARLYAVSRTQQASKPHMQAPPSTDALRDQVMRTREPQHSVCIGIATASPHKALISCLSSPSSRLSRY